MKKYLIIGIAFVSLLSIFAFTYTKTDKLTYLEFEQMVNDGSIESVKLNIDSPNIKVYSNGKSYSVPNPKSDNFKYNLLKNGIKVDEHTDNIELLTVIISMFTFLLLMVYVLSILNKSAGTMVSKTNVRLEDVVGIDEIKEDIVNTIEIFKNSSQIRKIGGRPTNGIILYGNAGVGKTMLAKAIANHGGMNFISCSGSDFIELYAGMGARKIRKIFAKARKSSPCVLFIDEIDAVGKRRGGKDSNGEMDQSINALLTELDGFENNNGVLVICATNRLDILDEALIRRGRFDKHIHMNLPNLKSRIQLVSKLLTNKNIENGVSFQDIGKITSGMSCATISSLINEAITLSYLDGSNIISTKHIDNALVNTLLDGVELKSDTILINKRVACHEAGHAICSKLLCGNDIYMISTKPTTSGSGGITISSPKSEQPLYTKNYLINHVATIYGGLAAEEIMFGEMTTGSAKDVLEATNILTSIVEEYGMGRYKVCYQQFESVSLVEELSEEAYNIAKSTLLENIDILRRVTEKLSNDKILHQEEFDTLI